MEYPIEHFKKGPMHVHVNIFECNTQKHIMFIILYKYKDLF